MVTDFWNHLLSVRATRNRLRLLKDCLKKEVQKFLNNSPEVRILSVASGSAQGVIEVMKEFKERPIRAIFLDLDGTALEHSKKLAEQAGIKEKITFVNKSARKLEEVAKDFQPQIVEMVGFLMYRPEKRAIESIKRIYRILAPNGVALISQDNHIIEKFFLYYVANWPLIFRSPKKFAELLIKGGFSPKNCKIVYEPLKMHGIGICKKNI
jgi:ubiquinone/menaquinone biosynthesis C-methylase UbiE